MLSDDSDVEDLHTLTINEHYAKAFEYRKEREELAKLKEKYGSDVDENEDEEEDSEEAESEDEEGEELTPAIDAAILRTLARIKRKDPSIYELGKDVFEEERQQTRELSLARAQKDKSKPVTIRQHALASALEDASGSRSPSPEPLTHVQEQSKLREETIAAFHTSVGTNDGDEDEEDDLLVLQREVGEDLYDLITVEDNAPMDAEGAGKDVSELNSKKSLVVKKVNSGKSRQEDQKFLLNYILNRGWVDRSARRLPTYKEITGSKNGKRKADEESGDPLTSDHEHEGSDGADAQTSMDEDEFDEVADRFESTYNFRFEEPGAAEIARHPRNLPSLVRRQDTARKEAREKRKARKEEELLKKKEEVKRLKSLKMKELRTKLERIGHEGGKKLEESKALQALDLDGDWDPDSHDRQMAELYANDAATSGDNDFVDDAKPTWDDDIDITDIVPPEAEDLDAAGSSKRKKKKKRKRGEDDEIDQGGVDVDEMDADVEWPPVDDEEWDGTEEMRKRKLEEYMDQVYNLDFNDMVGEMPTRFRYTKVEPHNFGLSPAEILVATDAELNTYMGIKKYAPYRKEGKGRNWDANRSMRLKELKATLQDRGVADDGQKTRGEIGEKVKKRKGKKERMREKAAAAATTGEAGGEDHVDGEQKEEVTQEAKRKRENEANGDGEDNEEHDEAGERSTKKKRRRHKKSSVVAS